jgi:hypothetical protein
MVSAAPTTPHPQGPGDGSGSVLVYRQVLVKHTHGCKCGSLCPARHNVSSAQATATNGLFPHFAKHGAYQRTVGNR